MADTLVLIRHGRIEANSKGLWHGSTDSPLLPKGLQQAKQTGEHLAEQGYPVHAIYASPLERCQNTAAQIASALNSRRQKAEQRGLRSNRLHRLSRGLLGDAEPVDAAQLLEPVVHDDLREYCIGEWEGRSFSELDKEEQFIERAARDTDFAPPGGESLRAVSERISSALAHIHAQHEAHENVLVVAHGAVMGIALATLLNQDPAKWMDYHFDNCSISELLLGDFPARLPELRRFNMTGHL
ncbi:MAG: histidine phosphatase family protein [Pseudomonadales bacterium]